MDRADLAITLDTPSSLLRDLGVKGDLLLLPAFPGTIQRLYEKSRIVRLDLLDDVIRCQGEECYRILWQEIDAWGLIRMQDQAGNMVTCIGFHFDPIYNEYFCEVSLEQPRDPLRRLLLSSLRLAPHKLLPFRSLLSL